MPSSVLLASRARALGRQLLVAASALLLVTCTDNPTGPTVGSTLRLAVSPRFVLSYSIIFRSSFRGAALAVAANSSFQPTQNRYAVSVG